MNRTPEEIARAIAAHAFRKHVLIRKEFSGEKARYGRDTGVRTREDFEAHILKVLSDQSTKGFQSADGELHFYHKDSNTYVTYNESAPHLGTAYRPTSKRFFDREWTEDARDRGEWVFEMVSENGGYRGLLEKLGRQLPERSIEPVPRKSPFELARERALNAPAPARQPSKERDKDRDR